jgi:hypothetical protein
MIYGYIGSGILIKNVAANNNKSFSYNQFLINAYETEDLGSVSSNTINSFEDYDYIFFFNNSYQNYGSISVRETLVSFGSLSLSGSANTEWVNKNFSGAGEYKVTYSPDDTSGTLFSFGEKSESIIYDYNEESIKVNELDDYGQIVDVATENYDDGLISQEIDSEFDGGEFAKDTITSPIEYPFGSLSLSGSANTEWVNKNFSGAGEYKVTYSPDDTSGTLFSFSEKLESATYDYNEESVKVVSTESLGLLTDSITVVDDYGSVTTIIDDLGDLDDYEGIDITSTNNPFGSLSLSGSANTEWINKNFSGAGEYKVTYSPDNTSGTLFSFGERLESVTYDYNEESVKVVSTESLGLLTDSITVVDDHGSITAIIDELDDYEGIDITSTNNPFGSLLLSGSANTEWVNKNFSGAGEYKVTYSPDNTSGTLFSFGEKVESIIYDYNIDSIKVVSTESLGLLTDSITVVDDHGSITAIIDELDDYEGIDITSTNNPFGSLLLTGSANTEWVNKNFSGAGEYKVTYSPDNTSGTLFSFGEKVESVTYDYNEESIKVNELDDYGQIVDVATENYDDGLISQGIDSEFDGGEFAKDTITSPIEYPFGSLSLSGSVLEEFSAQTPENTILFTFSGSLVEKFVSQTPENIQLFTYSGSVTEKHTESYVGSGTLFSFGEKSESIIYDYNIDSIKVNELDDYGQIVDVATENYDDGLISQGIDPAPDGGEFAKDAITSPIEYPFGSLLLTGSANTEWINKNFSGAGEYKVVYSPDDTSGTLFSFSEKLESATYDYNIDSIKVNELDDYGQIVDVATENYDDGLISQEIDSEFDGGEFAKDTITSPIEYPFGSILLTGSAITQSNYRVFFYGSATEKHTKSYVGFGSLFEFGEKLESVTYNYNDDSISVYYVEDYLESGLLTTSPTLFDDYNSITDIFSDPIDYGLIFGFGSSETLYPFGSVTFSGTSMESKTYPYIGLGTLTIPGTALESETQASYIGLGTLTISGTVLESETESYVGSGSLFKFGEKIQSRTYNYNTESLYENTEDYGLVSQITLKLDDYESITSFGYIEEYGLITELILTPTEYPFGSVTLSGTSVESETESYVGFVGLGKLTISETILESETESYVGLGTLTISGTVLEKDTESYVTSGTINLGKIYIGDNQFSSNQTTFDSTLETFDDNSFIFSSALESETESYVGLGTITLSNSGLESRTIFIPSPGIGTGFSNVVIISISNTSARYYSPVYPRNALITDPSSGIGTIRINDDNEITLYRATLPYLGIGTISLSGIGLESFSIVNYDGSGLLTFSGISSNREINVYQDYVTSGAITISQQTQQITEKHTESYVGIGTIIKFATLSERVVNSYSASGGINLGKIAPTVGTEVIFSSALESFSVQTPENTVLYTFSGSALEAYSAQTPEDTVLYTFDESLVERIAKSYSGEGIISFNGNANEFIAANPSASGNIRFTTHLSDNLYDTCDSIDITSDYQNSAFVSFIANPPESTQLFSILGLADTSKINLYEYVGVGNLTFSGPLVESETDSYVGEGTLFTLSGASEVNVNSYEGSGPLFAISGVSESKSSQTSKNTILTNIFGTASTKLEFEYSYSGIGTAYINGSASTKLESDYSYSGIGSITLSGELVPPDIQYVPAFKQSFTYSGTGDAHINGSASTKLESDYSYSGIGSITLSGELVPPNIQFIPVPKGFGLFTLSGISSNSISRIGILSGNKTLFAFSGGFESFSRPTYIGLGTIYIQEVSGIAINNPFQMPRTYVVII